MGALPKAEEDDGSSVLRSAIVELCICCGLWSGWLAVGDPGTRKTSGMRHARGLLSPTQGYVCAQGPPVVWLAASRSRVA